MWPQETKRTHGYQNPKAEPNPAFSQVYKQLQCQTLAYKLVMVFTDPLSKNNQ